jgi:branched-chain amino acid transport system substrate-binding protein
MTRRSFVAALLVGVAAATAGCTLDVPPPTPPTPTVPPATLASELPIGVVLSLSGRYSREGALMRAGYTTWADAVHQAGGIKVGVGRRTVRLIFADDESEPLNAGRQTERLVSTERIRLLLGPFSAAITTTVATTADRLGALVVAPDASYSALYRRGLKTIISIQAPDDRLFHGFADLAATAEPRAQPVGILIADEPGNAASAAGFRERAAALDVQPVRLELTALGSQDITAPLERIAALAPRTVILATEAAQIARVAPILREIVPFTAMRALMPMPAPIDPAGRRSPLYDGALTVETWWPTIAAAGPVLGSAADFAERFRRLHGYLPDPRGAAAAAAGLALQIAAEAAGSEQSDAIRDAFMALDLTTFWGRMAWDAAGRNRLAVAPVLQQQGEALVTVYPTELAVGRLRYPLAGWPRG